MPRKRMSKQWRDEFRGFFWGEGCLDIVKYKNQNKQYNFYKLRARIGLHKKDINILLDIKDKLGGNIYFRKNIPSVTWELTGKHKLLNLISILNNGILSAIKQKDFILFKKAIKITNIVGKKFNKEQKEKMLILYNQLQNIKVT